MIRKISCYICRKIHKHEKCNQEICEYGLELIGYKVLHVFIILLMGVLCNQFINSIIFLAVYSQLRRYAGGFHADDSIKCTCYTFLITMGMLYLINLLEKNNHIVAIFFVSLGCSIIIWGFAPVDSKNKPLDSMEIIKYRSITHRAVLSTNVLICLFMIFKIHRFYAIECSLIFEAMGLLYGIKDSPRFLGVR